MLLLSYEKYKKNQSLFKEECLIWDLLESDFIKGDSKKLVVKIKEILKLSDKEKKQLQNTLKKWQKEVNNIELKDYNPYSESEVLYKNIAQEIEGYICRFEKQILVDFGGNEINKNDYNYFCAYVEYDNLCVSIGIFSIKKDEQDRTATLERSLAYPQSQSIKEKRKNGVIGACGHNLRVSIINYVFSDNSVQYIYSNSVNEAGTQALEKLGFN